MFKKERIPFPSSKSLETMKGEVSEEKEVVGSGEKKFIRLIEKGGGLIGVPDKKEWAGILNHSLLVRRVSTYLAQELEAAGEDVDLETVSEAALLHDIGKRQEKEEILYKKEPGIVESHAQKGAKILKEGGFSKEISETVVIHHFPQKKEELDTWDKKLVFYADVRATQSIMSLENRLSDIEKRWVSSKKITQEEMDRTKKIAQDVEQEIFSKLDIKPDDILDLPVSRVERYLRTIIERNLEDRAIKFFRNLENRKSGKKVE